MNSRPERSAVIAAWLEEGPNVLPESTRRAIAVGVRTTRQARRSAWSRWRLPPLDRMSLVALAAVAVILLAVAGLLPSFAPDPSDVGGPPPGPTASASPSPSEAPSATTPRPTALVSTMTETYVSARYGYAIGHPAEWSVAEASRTWWPPQWKVDPDSDAATFDFIRYRGDWPYFRVASAPLPARLPSVNAWIDQFLTFGDPNCVPPREAQELISIDGAPGRLRDTCGEVEATIVLEGRVYMFTLAFGDGVTNGRELFDAFAATIDLRPEAAALLSPSP